MKTIVQTFQEDVEAFLKRHDMRPTNFGILCNNNTALVIRIRSGAVSGAPTIDKIRAWMRGYDATHPVKKKRRVETRSVAA